ncbi:hypothetical protein L2Y96_21775 [Luteibacter aegosomaticola]|uniref:hypothetical protein n=1 Tax=Luteibacter aegosomaticola TaxID=2911538 RepID=UPI001FFBE8FE|nr:hypothetical protein [Luteibacter aegosomaticola]UPG89974.1 hypothetical protein L2Y96_21775 [Luteibacter aegosomaticola]
MLSLEDERWATLQHVYGSASDIPPVLARLKASPSIEDRDLWDILWGSLNHQSEVCDASFAAVPHVIDAIANHPESAHWHCFAFIASIEVGRVTWSYTIPDFLVADYAVAWHRIPPLIGRACIEPRGSLHTRGVLAALAASQQQPLLAEVLLEANEAELPEMLEWWQNR